MAYVRAGGECHCEEPSDKPILSSWKLALCLVEGGPGRAEANGLQ
jgi:hypothetical protein